MNHANSSFRSFEQENQTLSANNNVLVDKLKKLVKE
jgi:hypothetical protein